MSVVARRVLVTGGAGFLGSHLCERLVAEGDDVLTAHNPTRRRLARAIMYFDKLLSECDQSSAERQSSSSGVLGRMGQ